MLGDRIRQLRIDAKMTQPELAARLEVTRSAVATYENNTRQPSYQILIRIARIFGVTTDYLLLGESHDFIDVKGLSPEQKILVTNLIKNFKETNEIISASQKEKK